MQRFSASDYGSTLAQYEGDGRLISATDSFACRFRCRQMHDGTCILEVSDLTNTATPGTLQLPFVDVRRFEGAVDDGRSIEADAPIHEINALDARAAADPFAVLAFRLRAFRVFSTAKEQAQQISYGLTNFFFLGVGRRLADGRDALPLTLVDNGNALHALLLPGAKHRRLRLEVMTTRATAASCELQIDVSNAPDASDLSQYDETVSDLTWVLSVARGTKVQWIYRTVASQDGTTLTIDHTDRVTRAYAPHRVIPDDWSAARQAAYIEPAYTAFRERRETFRLKAVIDAYIEAKAEEDFIQTRALKLAAALEAMKHAFVLSQGWEAEYFIEEKLFKKLVPRIRKAIASTLNGYGIHVDLIDAIRKSGNDNGLNRRTFGSVVNALAQTLGLRIPSDELLAFARSRNTLVHQGQFYASVADEASLRRMPYDSNVTEYFFDMYFLDRLILALLAYTGEYRDARAFNRAEILRMTDYLDPTADRTASSA